MKKKWKNEVARDALALGSIPFYFIVLIRAVIGEYLIFVYQLLIALAVIAGISYFIKKSNNHVARCFSLFVFTSIFYDVWMYTAYAFLLFVIVMVSSAYIKFENRSILEGLGIGAAGSIVAYYLAAMI